MARQPHQASGQRPRHIAAAQRQHAGRATALELAVAHIFLGYSAARARGRRADGHGCSHGRRQFGEYALDGVPTLARRKEWAIAQFGSAELGDKSRPFSRQSVPERFGRSEPQNQRGQMRYHTQGSAIYATHTDYIHSICSVPLEQMAAICQGCLRSQARELRARCPRRACRLSPSQTQPERAI